MVRCDLGERAALLAEDPETFFVTPATRPTRAWWVRLATVRPDQLRELLTEAWRLVAPQTADPRVDETWAVGWWVR